MSSARIACIAVCTALLACAHEAPQPAASNAGPASRALDEAIAQGASVEREAPPRSVVESLLPPLVVPALPDAEDEPRFDVSVERAPAREFFVGLVEGTPYNIVVHPDVKGRISLQLKNVTVRQVLEVARDVYGYEYHQTPAGFQVQAPGLRTRIFEVSYLDVRRDGESNTRVSSGQVSDRVGGGDSNGSSAGGEGQALGPEAPGAVSGSRIATHSAVDVWENLRASLDLIVGRDEGRSVVMSSGAGIVSVRAFPDELRDVEYYLASVERSVHRQVILEAKIIEVTLDDGFRTGINWASLSFPGDDDSILTGQTGGGTLLDSTGLSEIAGNLGILDPRQAGTPPPDGFPSTTDTSMFGGAFTVAIQSDEFAGLIELLESQGKVQVLSSPRVSTLNNQKAVIKVGSDEFFVTDISTTTVTGTSTTTNPDVELTPFFSGIALDVTPQIGSDGYVTLHVHPSISQVQDQIKLVSLGGEDVTLPLALSTIRESDSVVRARSGQVIVIGGLMQDNEAKRSAGTPWLGRLPLLGYLFSHRLEESFKKELVILVRPVVVDGGTWTKALQESAGRVRAMDGDAPASGER